MRTKVFLLIFTLALVLRFFKLGEAPASLNWDENSNAYNAFSILKTAKDEYGKLLPLYNRSFDDYKPPIYMYLNVPTVAIFGLTPFAARLPSAILGVLTVVAIYFLTLKILNSTKVALLSMFMLSTAPWHLQFSRVGFEANVGLFFAAAAFTLLLYCINSQNKNPAAKNYWLVLLSAIFFGLSFYSYHSARIFIPALFAIFALIYRKEILTLPKKIIIAFLIICICLITPFFIFAPKQAISQRLETTSLSTHVENLEESVKLMSEDKQNDQMFSKIIHNRRLIIARSYLSNYLSHFDLNYLFTRGDDNLRHHTAGMGMLFLYQLPLVLMAIFIFARNRKKGILLIIAWLLFSPLPAVPTNAVPHAVRSLTMVIPLQILTAVGITHLLSNTRTKKAFAIIAILIVSFAMLTYLHTYYNHYIKINSDAWQYGYSQAATESNKLKNLYEKIIVDPSIEQGYIFFLFNTKFDPATFQRSGNSQHFDKYYFTAEKPSSTNVLYISEATKFPSDFEILTTIYYPNKKEAIKIGHL